MVRNGNTSYSFRKNSAISFWYHSFHEKLPEADSFEEAEATYRFLTEMQGNSGLGARGEGRHLPIPSRLLSVPSPASLPPGFFPALLADLSFPPCCPLLWLSIVSLQSLSDPEVTTLKSQRQN